MGTGLNSETTYCTPKKLGLKLDPKFRVAAIDTPGYGDNRAKLDISG